jgi:hypothetical protein
MHKICINAILSIVVLNVFSNYILYIDILGLCFVKLKFIVIIFSPFFMQFLRYSSVESPGSIGW